MNEVTTIALGVIALGVIIYFGSRLQMKGWLHEIKNQFKNEYQQFVTKRENEKQKKQFPGEGE